MRTLSITTDKQLFFTWVSAVFEYQHKFHSSPEVLPSYDTFSVASQAEDEHSTMVI